MEPGAPSVPRCRLEPRPPLEPGPAALCALGCLLGLVCGGFGYRCFKAIMFLSGLLLGSAVIFVLCYKERVLETQLSLEVSAGIALGIGALCGLLTALVRSVGLFTTGLLLGLLLATAALVATAPLLQPQSPWVPAGGLLGLALLCALLALHWQKPLTVLATAVCGAAAVVACADYALEALALLLYVYDRLRLAPPEPLCWYSWAVLGAWPALSLLGVLVQWKLTAGGFSHSDEGGQAPPEPGPPRGHLPPQAPPRQALRGRRAGPELHPEPAGPAAGERAPPGPPDDDCGSTVPLTAPPAARPPLSGPGVPTVRALGRCPPPSLLCLSRNQPQPPPCAPPLQCLPGPCASRDPVQIKALVYFCRTYPNTVHTPTPPPRTLPLNRKIWGGGGGKGAGKSSTEMGGWGGSGQPLLHLVTYWGGAQVAGTPPRPQL
ncbi:transmembrane protein 198-like isoform X2 [Anas platyrhynchos]